MNNYTRGDIVEITWLDASRGDTEWTMIADHESDDLTTYSVGYFFCEDEESITIAQSLTDNQLLSTVQIPRVCIKSMVKYGDKEVN